MKKTLICLVLGVFSLNVFSQILLEETTVEPPIFVLPEYLDYEENEGITKSPIAKYIEVTYEIPENLDFFDEGIVGIRFTVNADGDLYDFRITNSINNFIDQSIISCIKKSSGLWIPGKVNGKSSPMEKTVFVRFDDPSNESFHTLAVNRLRQAQKQYFRGINFSDNLFWDNAKKEKKSKRQYNRALANLKNAQRYYPNDPSIFLWEAKSYNKLGNLPMMRIKLENYNERINQALPQEYYTEEEDLAIITLK